MDSPARPSQPKMASSTGGTEGSSPASSPASAASLAAMAAPKFGTLVPNRIFVGGISASTSEAELAQLFSAYGNVKATKIIADRGGVSKGYGFVTFETEEEAKRLQQESECIVLRERKLNIAPAIKKQPFNRSFDGGTGSPPAVPTSTYYYTNGMGLPYQNGMTFYNAGAPAPGAAMAPPTDPATLYQAAGVFGPQATASHQTFAPVMYPVPAPSLYMPQQYQYSPMPYEPYYPGTTAAGAPQFLYATNGAQTTTGGSGNGSGNSGSGTASGGAGATSPASAAPSLGPSPPQFQAHFYGPATTATHHHPGALAGAPHAPPPPPPQMEHLYYSYPPPPHGAQPPPHHSGQLTLAGDQQLLVYTTEITSQNSANDSQVSQQEDSRSTSSHSEQLQQAGSGGTATSDSGGGGGGGQPPDPSAPPTMLPLMPLKYPLSNRYATFHPMTIQQQQQSSSAPHQQTSTATNPADGGPTSDDLANAPVTHYRTMSLYPSPLYIPPGTQYHPSTGGGSLLPTPPQQPYDLGAAAAKFRDYSKSGLVSHPYAKGPPPGTSPLLHHQSAYVKQYNGPPLHPPPPAHAVAAHQKYPRVTTPPARLSHHQSYGKRSGPLGHQQHQHHHLGSPAYYFSQKSCQYGAPNARGAQHFVCGGQPGQLSAYSLPHIPTAHNSHKGYASYEYGSSGRRSVGSEYTSDSYSASRQASRKNAIVNSYRGSNLTLSAAASNTSSSVDASGGSNSSSSGKAQPSGKVASETSVSETSATATVTTTTTATTTTAAADSTSSSNSSSATTEKQASATTAPSSASNTPPPTSYSPMTRPHPNLSPSPNLNTQVQFFGTGSGGGGGSCNTPGQRFNTSSSSSLSQQQQQRNSGTRYPMSVSSRGGKAANVLRQNSGGGGGGGGGGTKYKMNGIVQSSGKLPLEENSLGGAGDAPPVGRLPLTPPGTPQQTSSEQNQQLNESCHQMQALTL